MPKIQSQIYNNVQNSTETHSSGSSIIQYTNTSVKLWRPALLEDVYSIQQLISPTTKDLFGELDLPQLM